MKREKRKYFLFLSIAIALLFVLDCFSIIYCVINAGTVPSDKNVEHTLGFVYLFLHMIVLAILMVLSTKAYANKSLIINIIMTNEKGEKNKKAVIIASIFAGILAVIGVSF